MRLGLKQKDDVIKDLAFDISHAVEGHSNETVVQVMSLMLARYIMESRSPDTSYWHSSNILQTSFSILKGTQ